MYATKVRFQTVEDAKKFVSICTDTTFPVTLSSGAYVIDAKSIMGLFSLDLSKAIDLEAECPEDEPFVERLAAFTLA